MSKIHIIPLAAESLGVRSMACGIKTPDLTLLLDPGCSLGPTHMYPLPHPKEWIENKKRTENILKFASKTEILFISHFHRDHYKIPTTDYFYINSNPEIAHSLYYDKIIYSKDPQLHLGHYQLDRAQEMWKFWQQTARKVISVSSIISNLVQIGQTEIIFPHEFHHSYPETRLGYIQPLLLRYEDEEIYYWPDVHGFHYQPDQDLFIQFLLKLIPSSKFQNSCHRSLILGGPPTSFFNNFNQATKIAQKFSPFFEFFDLILIDHHLFRENTWLNLWDQGLEKIQGNLSEKRKNKISIQSYYEFLQNSPFSNKIQNIAEANRNELYENDPLSPEYLLWGDRCRAGNVSEYPPIP